MSTMQPLHLYRSLQRAGRRMPSDYKRSWVLKRVRMGFEELRGEGDPTVLQQAMVVGETHLESLEVQVSHLEGIVPQLQREAEEEREAQKELDKKLDPFW
eukprot:TRINITY_DN21179_c0_g1_i1.p3 TRINITY_DN21179_c0_g1~~TRINITY_DN21179_c0_g1_i1.p3  ORF type:complete len:100 (+),score=41.03 TRINITY_DN21179_c0_g1_i1:408-707(+)